MKLMLSGLQAMSICKDTRKLAVKVGEMIDDILNGRAPDVNDTTTYNNNYSSSQTYGYNTYSDSTATSSSQTYYGY